MEVAWWLKFLNRRTPTAHVHAPSLAMATTFACTPQLLPEAGAGRCAGGPMEKLVALYLKTEGKLR